MSRKEISLTKESTLNFQLDIVGTDSPPEVRLNVILDEMTLALPGVVEGDTAVVKFPNLTFLSEKYPNLEELDAKLEVVVENQIFIPWEDTLNIKREIKVKAEESILKHKPPINIKVTSAKVDPLITKENTKTSEKLLNLRLAREKRLK